MSGPCPLSPAHIYYVCTCVRASVSGISGWAHLHSPHSPAHIDCLFENGCARAHAHSCVLLVRKCVFIIISFLIFTSRLYE